MKYVKSKNEAKGLWQKIDGAVSVQAKLWENRYAESIMYLHGVPEKRRFVGTITDRKTGATAVQVGRYEAARDRAFRLIGVDT